jgi:hypothetical protein
MTRAPLLLLIALACACAPPAAHEEQPAVAGVEPAVTDRAVKCREIAPTGTRIQRRTCLRTSDEERAQRDAREALDTMQRRAAGQTTTGN